MRVLFVISSLRLGGAERVAALLLNDWAMKGMHITLVTFDHPKNDFYALHPEVKRYSLDLLYMGRNFIIWLWHNALRFIKLRKTIKDTRPDIIISFMDIPNILALAASYGLCRSVIISERTYPPYFKRKQIYSFIRDWLYPRAVALVVQNNLIADWAKAFLVPEKVIIIPNPLHPELMNTRTTSNEKSLLAVGRLDETKGFDMLIKAFAPCALKHPDWILNIVGEGQERQRLEVCIKDHKLENHVFLVGKKHSVEACYASGSIFVLSSRVEGFPNALLEAMASGFAVISFDCKAGPKDIIHDGLNGLLVPDGDTVKLTEAILKFIEDDALRLNLSQKALKVREEFALETISRQWLDLMKRFYTDQST